MIFSASAIAYVTILALAGPAVASMAGGAKGKPTKKAVSDPDAEFTLSSDDDDDDAPAPNKPPPMASGEPSTAKVRRNPRPPVVTGSRKKGKKMNTPSNLLPSSSDCLTPSEMAKKCFSPETPLPKSNWRKVQIVENDTGRVIYQIADMSPILAVAPLSLPKAVEKTMKIAIQGSGVKDMAYKRQSGSNAKDKAAVSEANRRTRALLGFHLDFGEPARTTVELKEGDNLSDQAYWKVKLTCRITGKTFSVRTSVDPNDHSKAVRIDFVKRIKDYLQALPLAKTKDPKWNRMPTHQEKAMLVYTFLVLGTPLDVDLINKQNEKERSASGSFSLTKFMIPLSQFARENDIDVKTYATAVYDVVLDESCIKPLRPQWNSKGHLLWYEKNEFIKASVEEKEKLGDMKPCAYDIRGYVSSGTDKRSTVNGNKLCKKIIQTMGLTPPKDGRKDRFTSDNLCAHNPYSYHATFYGKMVKHLADKEDQNFSYDDLDSLHNAWKATMGSGTKGKVEFTHLCNNGGVSSTKNVDEIQSCCEPSHLAIRTGISNQHDNTLFDYIRRQNWEEDNWLQKLLDGATDHYGAQIVFPPANASPYDESEEIAATVVLSKSA